MTEIIKFYAWVRPHFFFPNNEFFSLIVYLKLNRMRITIPMYRGKFFQRSSREFVLIVRRPSLDNKTAGKTKRNSCTKRLLLIVPTLALCTVKYFLIEKTTRVVRISFAQITAGKWRKRCCSRERRWPIIVIMTKKQNDV